PTHLFHYTSIANLCLILKNKSIRFQRLDKVNDPEEAKIKYFPDAKHHIYVSCWTNEMNNKESIPLWNMYSSGMKGVRIRLPINMFKGRNQPDKTTTDYPIIYTNSPIYIERKNSSYPGLIVGPVRVKYKNNPEITANCLKDNNSTVKINLLPIGHSKHKHWIFEKEWRYKIFGMPFEGTWNSTDLDCFFEFPQNQFIDVQLDDSVINEMIIQMGPKASLSECIMVDLLVKEYAKGAKVCDSSVKINR
ncbi:hypothetical protein LCGC14_1923110, partial [marine sediment metagenome]